MEIISSKNLKPKGGKISNKERSVVEGADCCETTLMIEGVFSISK